MDSQLLLFFSPKCRYCQNILSAIEDIDIKPTLVNIHVIKNRPKFLKQVPTILATDSTTIFEGKLAFKYVENQRQFRLPTNNVDAAKQIKHNYSSELLKQVNNGEIDAYNETEYGTNIKHPSLFNFDI